MIDPADELSAACRMLTDGDLRMWANAYAATRDLLVKRGDVRGAALHAAVEKNNNWLHHRVAALNLRRLLALGLNHEDGTWVLA